jgi:hypothetical protein
MDMSDTKDFLKIVEGEFTPGFDVPPDEYDAEELVQEWNKQYGYLGREVRLKDLSPEAYEAEVANELFGVVDSWGHGWDMALKVLNHPKNKGGWMMGDVASFIKRKIAEEGGGHIQ